MAAGVVLAILLVNPSAFSWRRNVPFTVDSEIRHYQFENMESVATPESKVGRNFAPPPPVGLVTSYNEGGSEVILSGSIPNQTLKSIAGQIFLMFWSAADGFKRRFLLDPDEEAASFAVVYPSGPFTPLVLGRRDALLSSGCRTSHGDAKVIGEDVVLNYPVTVVQEPHQGGNQMATIWMAPALSCFALRVTVHAKQTDGTWKMRIERQAVKVEIRGQ